MMPFDDGNAPGPDAPKGPGQPPASSSPGPPHVPWNASAVTTGQEAVDDILFQGRLHPFTLLFALWNALRGFIVTFFILLVVGQTKLLGGVFVLLVILPFLIGVMRYFTFRYWIQGADLVTRQGLLLVSERHIPLDRVQDLRVEQGILHRFLAMADVHVETGGGQGAEATLSVLSMAEADRLRRAVFAQKTEQGSAASELMTESGVTERHTLREVSLVELILAGVTSNHLASALALVTIVFGLLDDIVSEETMQRWLVSGAHQVETVMGTEGGPNWALFLAGATAIFAVGLFLSVAGSILLFYRFTLARQGEDIHRSYGLFTRRASSLPRRRIQVLKIEEKLFRRPFGLATLRADTAGNRQQGDADAKSGRDVLLPVVPRNVVRDLLTEIFPDLPGQGSPWRPVSRRAIRRGTMKGALLCLGVTGILGLLEWHWSSLWPLAMIPMVYLLNWMSYRHLGYSLEGGFFQARRGWLSRSHHVVPIRNVQAVILRRSPLDRHHRVTTIQVDTAGQAYTGGGPQLGNVPKEDAEEVAWQMARLAAQLRYRS